MKRIKMDRRALIVTAATVALAGCQIVPKTTGPSTAPDPRPSPVPSETALPTDETRHRIALLVPMSGDNGAVGTAIANAATMALLDTNAANLRITTYDTATDARSAAARAIADGNTLILGPLMADNVPAVNAEARPARVPMISFSNDVNAASADTFIMGHIPSQSITRSVNYARQNGRSDFAAVVPQGEYGQRAEMALNNAVKDSGGRLVATERYSRGNTSIVSAAQRLKARGGYDTVLIADGARLASLAAGELKPGGRGEALLLGTELWSGEAGLTRTSALRGSIFSAVSDARFKRFAESYKTRFGSQPYRIATLGYDSVLLTLNVAKDWRVGRAFPVSALRDSGGFLGLDGPFRFRRNGVIERAMEVREVRDGEIAVVSPAPTTFGD